MLFAACSYGIGTEKSNWIHPVLLSIMKHHHLMIIVAAKAMMSMFILVLVGFGAALALFKALHVHLASASDNSTSGLCTDIEEADCCSEGRKMPPEEVAAILILSAVALPAAVAVTI